MGTVKGERLLEERQRLAPRAELHEGVGYRDQKVEVVGIHVPRLDEITRRPRHVALGRMFLRQRQELLQLPAIGRAQALSGHAGLPRAGLLGGR